MEIELLAMKKLLLSIILSALLAGCGSTSGARVSKDQAAQFSKGKTTIDEVITVLGKPNAKTTKDDGETLLQYVYASTTVRGATFIPIIGLLAGGADTETEVTGFTFDKNGVLKEVSRRESNHGSSMMGGSGQNQEGQNKY